MRKYSHPSSSTSTEMRFNVFLPPQASNDNRLPVLYWLSGLTCTEDNFMQKAAPYKAAVQHQIIIVAPDTSPRGLGLPGEKDAWDFGEGASFYVSTTRSHSNICDHNMTTRVTDQRLSAAAGSTCQINAAKEPWSKNYRMHDYITTELPAFIEAHFPVTSSKSISGHSMGGHGALISYLRSPPGTYQLVSAFAPIAHPSSSPWGIKAFTGYIGDDKQQWAEWDATELIGRSKADKRPILIDVGTADDNYVKKQLLPEELVEAGKKAGWEVQLRLQEGYDHSYYFVQTFMEEHIARHAAALKQKA